MKDINNPKVYTPTNSGTDFTTFKSSEDGVDTILQAYLGSLKDISIKLGMADHPLLCCKCKSNSWNMIEKRTKLRIKATCTICGNTQVLIKKNIDDLFVEVKI